MFHNVVPAGSDRETRLAASIPVGRIGRPDDVARAVLFFADPANSFVTGQTLFVCGGASIGTLVI
jgi:NAD(P)-dependent dehydrogenase (short-subunit alcohol dehydrogenase family)